MLPNVSRTDQYPKRQVDSTESGMMKAYHVVLAFIANSAEFVYNPLWDPQPMQLCSRIGSETEALDGSRRTSRAAAFSTH